MISTRRDAARLALALASVGAGVIHLALGPEHMAEWAVLGWGFYASGALQLAFGVLLVRRERLLRTGALLSLAFVGVWLVSRTTGLPAGPEKWEAEAVGRADLLCIGLELVVGIGALVLARRRELGRSSRPWTARALVAASAAAVLASTGAAVAAPAHEHSAAHSCAASATPTGVDANHDGADDGVQDWYRCLLEHEHDHHHQGYQPTP